MSTRTNAPTKAQKLTLSLIHDSISCASRRRPCLSMDSSNFFLRSAPASSRSWYFLSRASCLCVTVSTSPIWSRISRDALLESILFTYAAGTKPWRSLVSTFHQSYTEQYTPIFSHLLLKFCLILRKQYPNPWMVYNEKVARLQEYKVLNAENYIKNTNPKWILVTLFVEFKRVRMSPLVMDTSRAVFSW